MPISHQLHIFLKREHQLLFHFLFKTLVGNKMEFKKCHQGITTVSLKPIYCNCANDEVFFHLKDFSIMKLTASVKASVSKCIVYVFSSKSN